MIREVPWLGSPKVGWWRDRDPVRFYHGTQLKNVDQVLKEGLRAPTEGPTAGWVSLALDPNTAQGYASMGGESGFRAAGAKAAHVPQEQRAVLVVDLPRAWMEAHMNREMRGNIDWTRDRLVDRGLYERWRRSDSEYYQLTEIRVPVIVPPRFLRGYMRKVK